MQFTPYKKKIVGSAAALLIAGGGAFAAMSPALAEFVATGRAYNFEGVVTSANDHQSITVQTDGTAPLFVNIRHAHVNGGPITTGELVNVHATKEGPVITAHNVKVENGGQTGYGASGPVIINRATVVSCTGSKLVIRHEGTDITLQINSSTHFVGGHRPQCGPGDIVLVTGTDNGSAFVADTVVFLKNHSNGQSDDRNGGDGDQDDQ